MSFPKNILSTARITNECKVIGTYSIQIQNASTAGGE